MNYIILNNKKSTEIKGLLICSLPPISKPAKKINQEEIDGVDGDFITELGYKAYDKKISIGLTYNYDVDEVISYFDSEGTVIFSNEPDKYYKYKIIGQIDFERLIRFKTATVTMHVQPFKYSANEESTGFEEGVVTETGNPIHLTDSGYSPCDIAPLGASKQETREGYNKLPPMVEKTTTFQGRTYTSNGKGSLSVTGSATGSGATAFDLEKEIILGKENLYVHLLNNYATGAVGIRFFNGNTRVFEIVPTSANMITDIGTTYAGQTITAIQIYQNGSNNFDMTIQPMICTSNSSLEFEQYGASPSIEYEAPIDSVGDNIQLFDKEDTSKILSSGVDGNTLKVTSNNAQRLFYIECEPNTNYTISKLASTRLQFWDSVEKPAIGVTLNSVLNTDYNFTGTKKTVKTSTNGKYLVCYYYYSSSDTLSEEEIRNSIKICKGTSTGPYSPYGQGSIEVVNCNKNLLTKQPNVYYNPTGLTVADKQIGEFILNGTQKTQELRFLDAYNTKKCNYELPKGTYKFCTYISTKEEPIYTELTISDGSSYQQINGIAIEFEITKEGQGLGSIKVPVSSGTYNNVELKMMLIKSTDDETYVPHQGQTKVLYTQQPFRAIGDVKDRFVKQNGVCNEKHNIGRYIFTGNEGWKKSSRTDVNRYYVDNIINTILNASTVDILCSHFKALTPSQSDTAMIGISKYNEKGLMVNVDLTNTELDTVDKFKAKLTELYNAGTPVYVDYVLATPTLIPCTPEQVEVLNDIYSAYGEGMTNIICNDEIEPVIEIVKESKETVQSENDKAISALLARIEALEKALIS